MGPSTAKGKQSCKYASNTYKGLCFFNRNCDIICKAEGAPVGGRCQVALVFGCGDELLSGIEVGSEVVGEGGNDAVGVVGVEYVKVGRFVVSVVCGGVILLGL
ncbi:hypothetical protein CTI12_AA082520 [Artemisia annua]|uniref:Knottins-like domain-containing protein n=1 Tax=Artemisia annua TaxID=35608 RepID=A0A2U1Q270_ARTAN|nr:hypothetical protein CTI12_AA082520 [Artemisia annua]